MRSFTIGPPGDSKTDDQESRAHSVISTETRGTGNTEDQDDSTRNRFPRPGDQDDRGLLIGHHSTAISPPLDPGIDLATQRLLCEVGNWYNHLASPEHYRQAVPNAERAMLNDFNYKVNCGLKVLGHDNSPGWRMLLEQGFKMRGTCIKTPRESHLAAQKLGRLAS